MMMHTLEYLFEYNYVDTFETDAINLAQSKAWGMNILYLSKSNLRVLANMVLFCIFHNDDNPFIGATKSKYNPTR